MSLSAPTTLHLFHRSFKKRLRIGEKGFRIILKGYLMEPIKKEVLLTRAEIDRRVQELADIISDDYQGKELIVIGILKGAFVFMADLVRSLRIPCAVDFVRLASYGSQTVSSEKIVVTKDIETSIKGRDVLVVEDIVDTGLTLSFLLNRLKEREPQTLKVCVFLDKKERRIVPFEPDYVGFHIEDRFVVGYGLDFNEMFRYLPEVYVIEE
jgi:hypoxanthine phosphoribosyltransferase